jgi:hypothetical protein
MATRESQVKRPSELLQLLDLHFDELGAGPIGRR